MDKLTCLFDPSTEDEKPFSKLPPEVEEGNVEYKLKLVRPSSSRLEHLVTQLKWRLQEGDGEALYEIGVEDSGMLAGLGSADMEASLQTLGTMAEKLGATMSVLRKKEVDRLDDDDDENGNPDGQERDTKQVAEVLIRKVPENQEFIDVRLAVLGNVDAGKSTLLGVLTQGQLDNGRGRARLNLFRHLHEIQSGRTSSISHDIIGFDNDGQLVNYSDQRTAEDICETSSKLITLIDLCGHHKYLKTTIFGLTGYSPHFAMLVVNASTGIVGTTREHLGFALALGVPVFAVVSKTDACRGYQLERTLRQLERVLKAPGCKKIPFRVCCTDDAIAAAVNFANQTVCPIFSVSSVSGKNMELLIKFLHVLPPVRSNQQREANAQELTEHQVDEIYTIPSVGAVAGGTVLRGSVREGDWLMLGPADDGSFHPVAIGSIHRNRMPCRMVTAGQAACLSLGTFDACPVRKGMVLLSPTLKPAVCMRFEADVYVLFHSSYLCRGFQTVVHIGNVMQTAIILSMSKPSLRTNEKAVLTFQFINRPEYIRVGSQLLFREGKTKGMGEVTKIYTDFEPPPHR